MSTPWSWSRGGRRQVDKVRWSQKVMEMGQSTDKGGKRRERKEGRSYHDTKGFSWSQQMHQSISVATIVNMVKALTREHQSILWELSMDGLCTIAYNNLDFDFKVKEPTLENQRLC